MSAFEHAIAQEAGAWLFRLQDDDSAECRSEFDAWLQRSPQHAAQFLLMTATERELGGFEALRHIDVEALLAERDNVVELAGAPVAAAVPRPAHRARWAAAAALAGAVLAGGALWMANDWRTADYSTEIGEQRTVKLPDGSVVQLNTRSHIEVRFSKTARDIRLREGEALFTAAPEPERPFSVRSGPTLVQAVGTQFNIRRGANGATVSVVQGRVRILSQTGAGSGAQQTTAPVLLDAGQQAAVEDHGAIMKAEAPELDRALAWRQRHLEFRSATVAEIAAEFNRYNRLQIRVPSEQVAQRRMSGLFNADEPHSLVDFLASEGGVRFEEQDGAIVLLADER